MPFTPYHIGPNALVGLSFRRWVDPAVIVLVNVVVDVEVLFAPGWPHHRYWHFHTFLVGGIVGALFGLVCWRFKRFFNWSMRTIRIPYEAKLLNMVLAGVLGAWLHVLVDSLYHWDVQAFWPYKKGILSILSKYSGSIGAWRQQVESVCVVSWGAAILLYVLTVGKFYRIKKQKTEIKCNSKEK